MKIRDWLVKKLGGYTFAEYAPLAMKPVQFKVEQRKIDTLEVRKIIPYESVPYNDPSFERFIKLVMLTDLGEKLIDEGYAVYLTKNRDLSDPLSSAFEIRCYLDVVKPRKVFEEEEDDVRKEEDGDVLRENAEGDGGSA